MERSFSLDLNQVSIKCRSKKELYDVLVSDCGIYMPPIQFANSDYVRGKIKYIKSKDVNIISVSHIKSLNIQSIIEFAATNFDLDNYLPKYRLQRLPDRSWLCNLGKSSDLTTLVHTKLKEKFANWISNKMKEREKMIVMKKSFQINVLPEFGDAILKSNRVSVVNGRSHFLLRPPNKRRKIEEESKEILASKADLELENSEMLYQIEDLKAKANEFKMLYLENLKYKEQVEDLIKKRVVRKIDDEKMHF